MTTYRKLPPMPYPLLRVARWARRKGWSVYRRHDGATDALVIAAAGGKRFILARRDPCHGLELAALHRPSPIHGSGRVVWSADDDLRPDVVPSAWDIERVLDVDPCALALAFAPPDAPPGSEPKPWGGVTAFLDMERRAGRGWVPIDFGHIDNQEVEE